MKQDCFCQLDLRIAMRVKQSISYPLITLLLDDHLTHTWMQSHPLPGEVTARKAPPHRGVLGWILLLMAEWDFWGQLPLWLLS